MKRFSSLFLILTLLFMSAGICAEQGEKGLSSFSLFSCQSTAKDEPDKALRFFEGREHVTRYREVRINNLFSEDNPIAEGDRLWVDLFGEIRLLATVSRVSAVLSGTNSLAARVSETEGYFVLASSGDRSLATLLLPGEQLYYKVISDPYCKTHYLIEMDARDRDILEGCPPEMPHTDEEEESDPAQGESTCHTTKTDLPGPDNPAHIDLMVVYTQAAKNWANLHGGGIQNVVALSMANTQLVFDNSQTLVEFSLVYAGETDYEESGFSRIDLWRMITSPLYVPFGPSVGGGFGLTGHLEEIHALRNQHYADLVILLTRTYDTGGVAFTLNCRHGKPKYGFSVVRVQQAASSYTKAHEIGHLFGCHHHKEQLVRPGPTNWTNWAENTWSAGWRWQGDNGTHYCTVMAYTNGSFYNDGANNIRIPYFSSPNTEHQGNPAGHKEHGDNTRTILETKHLVAAYRTHGMPLLSTHPVSDIGLFEAASGGNMVFVCENHPVRQRGVVWDTIPFPTLERYIGKTEDGPGETCFTSQITGLDPDTDYFVSAYATNEKGTAYGHHRFFYTPVPSPVYISTITVRDVAPTRATAGGNITDGGNSTVYQRGIVWDTKPNPTVSSNKGITWEGTGEGLFSSVLGELSPGNTYFYRAYAKNTAGTNYGNQYVFDTPLALVSPNPFGNKLEVSFALEDQSRADIVLTDALGRVLKTVPVSTGGAVHITMDTSHLPRGMYFLRIENGQPMPVWRLMKAGP